MRLDRLFSAAEVKKAMFNMHCLKSPGTDGFTADSFQAYWEDVEELVVDSVQQFLRTGNTLKEWNQTLLVLISKVRVPEREGQFRPISLCNTVYKCISMCMVNRLKNILPGLISENQHAFIPSRYMEDNILLSHELMHLINSKKGSNFTAIKIDMSKAYDRVDWRTSGHFVPQCGLRQGDPLSPYLFIFCMDIHSIMLSLAEDINQFKGLKVSRRSPSISYLFFADDAMLFFKADEESYLCINVILLRFGKASGQQLNLQKSFIKFSPGFDNNKRLVLKSILSMPETDNMGTHLGAPIDIQGKKSLAFQFLVDRVSDKLVSCASLNLSQAAKLVLINTVLVSI
ncbi:uncharacterized protein LOC110726001 [Chenopodium quinoa]|uniref:uncharacterized protein LOC110726001 n=1 Tax=Chenopodium quinoa TaxID=63459 RepID=UPI000B77578D|nr:uncharacterized protein LOC110726001 [Chenopodium quinoa]